MLVCIAFALLSSDEYSPKGVHLPTPSEVDLERASDEIHRVFEKEFRRADDDDGLELARTLSTTAESEEGDSCMRYALLFEASRNAMKSERGLEVAIHAIRKMAQYYEIDEFDRTRDAIIRATKLAKSLEEKRHVFERCVELCDDWIERRALDQALKLLDVAPKVVVRPWLMRQFNVRRSRIDEYRVLRSRGDSGRSKLVLNPDDSKASFDVGCCLCFLQRDWASGLPYLARGSDNQFREVAAAESVDPSDPKSIANVASRWWELGASQVGVVRDELRKHAVDLYERVLPQLDGIDREAATSRLEAIIESAGEPARAGLVGRWLFDTSFDDVDSLASFVRDTSGVGANGTLHGVKLALGVQGYAAHFGGRDYITVRVPSQSPLPESREPKSIAWFQRIDAYPKSDSLVMISLGSTKSSPLNVGYRPGSPRGAITIWGERGESIVSVPAPSEGEWHRFVYTYDGSTHAIYVDGKFAAKSNKRPPENQPNRLEFGRYDGKDPDYLNGLLDEIRIYNRVLSEEEIKLLER